MHNEQRKVKTEDLKCIVISNRQHNIIRYVYGYRPAIKRGVYDGSITLVFWINCQVFAEIKFGIKMIDRESSQLDKRKAQLIKKGVILSLLIYCD